MKKTMFILVACAVGVAFSLAFASRGQSTTTRASCAGLSVPANSDFNLAYSPTTGDLLIQYYDSAGHGQDAVVDSRSAACKANPGVARAIKHALDASNAVTAGECASFKALLNGAPTIAKDGHTGNIAAANDYVATNCK